jgi:Holliday junction resolvase RusA-like endonuclease
VTRYADLATLRRNISPDVVVVDDDTARRLAIGLAALDADANERNAGDLGAETVQALGATLAAQSIVLPLPPSTNDNWCNYNGRTVLSEEARNYRAGVKLRANIAGLQPFAGLVAVYVHVYRANGNQDLDNYSSKALLDSLNGIMFHDDRQVVELHAFRHDDKTNPRVEVEVRRATG